MIGDMIAKLENEAEEDATEKAYCDEEILQGRLPLPGCLLSSSMRSSTVSA